MSPSSSSPTRLSTKPTDSSDGVEEDAVSLTSAGSEAGPISDLATAMQKTKLDGTVDVLKSGTLTPTTTDYKPQMPRPTLEILLAELKKLLCLRDAPTPLQDDLVLLSNVLGEVENWFACQDLQMICEAQIALAHSSGEWSVVTNYMDWSKEPARNTLVMYLQMMRRAHANGMMTDDMLQTLQTTIEDTERWLAELADDEPVASIEDQLNLLHAIGDYEVAYNNITSAINHVKSLLSCDQPVSRKTIASIRNSKAAQLLKTPRVSALNEGIQISIEYLSFLGGTGKAKSLVKLGKLLVRRYLQLGEKKDLDEAIERLQAAVDLTPGCSDDHMAYIAVLSVVSNAQSKALGAKPSNPDNSESGSPRVHKKSTMLSLNEMLSELNLLLHLDDILPLHDMDVYVIRNVAREVETWVNNPQSQLACNAQIALAHSASEPTAAVSYINWGKKPGEISIIIYQHLMQRACDSTVLDQEDIDTLQNAIRQSESWLARLGSGRPDTVYAYFLEMLHNLGDFHVAYYSIADAIQHIKASLSRPQPPPRTHSIGIRVRVASQSQTDSSHEEDLNQAVQAYTEFNEFSKASICLIMHGIALQKRFTCSQNITDLDAAILRMQEAVDLSPVNSEERAEYLGTLNSAISFREDIKAGIEYFLTEAIPQVSVVSKPLPPLNTLLSQLEESLLSAGDTLDHDRVLLVNVQREVKSWSRAEGSRMTCIAQLALAHSEHDPTTAMKYIDWRKKPAELSLLMYLHLMKRASDSGFFDEGICEMLQIMIQESEIWLLSMHQNNQPDTDFMEQLGVMQTVGDYSVACYSIATAINHIKACLSSIQPKLRILHILPRAMISMGEGSVGVLNQQIQSFMELLMFFDGAERSKTLMELGNALRRRFQQLGDRKDLDAQIQRLEETLQTLPPNSGDLEDCILELASAHHTRFTHFGEIDDINSAIVRYQEAMKLSPAGSSNSLKGISGLADSLLERFQRLGRVEDIDKAVSLMQEAVSLYPTCRVESSKALLELGTALLVRYDYFGNKEDLNSSINLMEEARIYLPVSSSLMNNLGSSYMRRFECMDNIDDITTAIVYLQEAAELDPSAASFGNLATAYSRRSRRLGQVNDFDLAIEASQKATKLLPLDHPDYPTFLANLGSFFGGRYERLHQRRDLEDSITCLQQALDLFQLMHPKRPNIIMNLANSYSKRYSETRDLADLDRVIVLQQTAADLLDPNALDRFKCLQGLATGLHDRYVRSGETKDLESAIQILTEVVKLRPEGVGYHMLALFFRSRYQISGSMADVELAVMHAQTAVDVTPENTYLRSAFLWNLGTILMMRWVTQSQDPLEFGRAISAFQSSSLSPYGQPATRFHAAVSWASYAHSTRNFELAAEGYHRAIQLLPLLAWIGIRAVSQLEQMSDTRKVHNLACDAAACMFTLAESNPTRRQQYLGQAVELLDQGRSILWSQTSQLKQDLADLQKIDHQLATELDEAGRTLAQGCFNDQEASEAEMREYRQAAHKWEELVARARKYPRFESFLAPSPISVLRNAAKHGPIVIVNGSSFRCDILIIPNTGDLLLAPLAEDASHCIKLAAQRASHSAPVRELEPRSGRPIPGPSQVDSLQLILHDTWRVLGEPIIQHLEDLGLLQHQHPSSCRVWWCLTGSFTFLPIHAAHPPRNNSGEQPLGMMDLIISSYTPTLSTLLRSQRQQSAEPTLVRVLAVGQSHDLPMVKDELTVISKFIPQDHLATLEDEQATLKSVSNALHNCTWAHFACHGLQDHAEPMNSGLKLYDSRLTLSKLAQMSLKSADLAFLSCCQSATGSHQFSGESVHIAAGMQFVGFRSVIGTLWSVGDREAQMVAEHIYRKFFQDGTVTPDSAETALLLNSAVRYLRDEVKVSLRRWVPFVHFGL